MVKALSDGSYLSVIYPSATRAKKQRQAATEGITVRVIDDALPNAAEAQLRDRLLTTLLDEHVTPALELAALSHQRWEVDAVFDELKTHLWQQRRVLRSKTADLVRQEFYGGVLAHDAVRWLMHQAAHRAPPARSKPVLHRARSMATLRTAPIWGLSPQRGQERVGGGLARC